MSKRKPPISRPSLHIYVRTREITCFPFWKCYIALTCHCYNMLHVIDLKTTRYHTSSRMLYIYPYMSLLSIKSGKCLSANPKTNGDLAVQVRDLHLPELASSGCSCRVTFTTYLIKVYDDISFQSSTAFHIFQGQGEVNPSGV